jgi:transposase
MFMQKLTRRTYTETFRAEAVTLAQSSNEGVAAVARSLGVDVTTLRTWLHRAQQPSSDSETLTPSERKELAQLRREVSVLKMEREILKNPPGGLRSVEPETPDVLSALLSGRSDRLLFGDARAR